MKSLSRLVLWMAALGLLFPRLSPAVADDTRPATRGQTAAQVAVVDVKLTDTGVLRGQLLNRDGAPKARRTVTVTAAGQTVAQVMTDAQGHFAVPLAKGGVYTISDGDTGAVLRVWTNAAAPPSAQGGILLVSDPTLARGNQDGRGPFAWMHEGGAATCLGVLAIAGVATAIIIAATDDDAS